MNKKTMLAVITGAALVGGAAAGLTGIASAQTTGTTTSSTTGTVRGHYGPGIFGKVTAVNGTTITVVNQKDTTSYTVDISNAKIMKASGTAAPAPATASAIAVGDEVSVRGAVSGTSVTATDVVDGIMPRGGRGLGRMMGRGVHGTVTAVNGNTITVTGRDGKTYTVDATSAALSKIITISTADVKVGDTIDAQGSVSGTTVTAKRILDGVPTKPVSSQAQ